MGDKHLTEDGWNRVAPKTLKDKRLGNALAAFERLAETKYRERIDALDLVIDKAREFKKLAECKPQLKYLDDVIKAAEKAKREIDAERRNAENDAKLAAKEKAKKEKEAEKKRDDELASAYLHGSGDFLEGLQPINLRLYAKDKEALERYMKGYSDAAENYERRPIK